VGNYYAGIMNNSYKRTLMHWGIKNQKWGVRRYRNYDGTLTQEGKARYGRVSDSGGGGGSDMDILKKVMMVYQGLQIDSIKDRLKGYINAFKAGKLTEEEMLEIAEKALENDDAAVERLASKSPAR